MVPTHLVFKYPPSDPDDPYPSISSLVQGNRGRSSLKVDDEANRTFLQHLDFLIDTLLQMDDASSILGPAPTSIGVVEDAIREMDKIRALNWDMQKQSLSGPSSFGPNVFNSSEVLYAH